MLEDLNTLSEKRGLPIKVSETWASSRMFAYRKNLFYKGFPCKMMMKKLQRLTEYPNESFPTLETAFSSNCANGMQAGMSSLNPFIPFFMTILYNILAMKAHFEYSIICRGPLQWKYENLEFQVPKREDNSFININVPVRDGWLLIEENYLLASTLFPKVWVDIHLFHCLASELGIFLTQ